MEQTVYINDAYLAAANAKVLIFDRDFLFAGGHSQQLNETFQQLSKTSHEK